MNWLDRNMESLLQQAPAPTVRFIAHNKEPTSATAVAAASPQQQPVKHFIDATAEPINSANIRLPTPTARRFEASAASSLSSATASSSKPLPAKVDNSKPVQAEKPKPVDVPVVDTALKKHYSAKELSQADKRRKHEFRQLQTRFCDTFRTVRYVILGLR